MELLVANTKQFLIPRLFFAQIENSKWFPVLTVLTITEKHAFEIVKRSKQQADLNTAS
jgi:hypothetical protein